MKIIKYIFIYTISLCITAQAITLTQICMGPDHCEPGIDWVSNCHTQPPVHNDSHECSFDHSTNECIDISITTLAISSSYSHFHNQPGVNKPLILKISTPDHPFYASDFSKLKTNLFPVFADMTTLSIASTILIV